MEPHAVAPHGVGDDQHDVGPLRRTLEGQRRAGRVGREQRIVGRTTGEQR
jgi:hypothetical protein